MLNYHLIFITAWLKLGKIQVQYCITKSGSFHQPPAAKLSKRRRKITKPPIQGSAPINPPRQLWAHPYQSARQLWVRPDQSVRQQATTTYKSPVPPPLIAWGSLLLHVCSADPPSPSDQGQQRSTYPSSPFEHGILDMAIWR
jgi:hypothetical protein